MGQQEGIDHLLRMVRYIVSDKGRRDVHLVLVGGGTALKEMQTYAVELGISEYVTFTGRVPDQDLLTALCISDVCINPDIANEMNDKSTMNKIMGYMALGKPIVQYDLTEGRFSAQEASLYARPNDEIDFAEKILVLLYGPVLREKMGGHGRRRVVEELQWEHEKPKLLQAYEVLFASPSAMLMVPALLCG